MKRPLSLAALLILAIGCAYSQHTREIKKILDLSENGKLFIDTYKGSITIETWDKPQVDIVARIEADGRGKDDEEAVDQTYIDIDGAPDRIRIRSDYDKLKRHDSWLFGWFGDGDVSLPLIHYTISMPRSARLTVKDYKSDSRIRGPQGHIDYNTYKGSVDINGLQGSIDLETYKGRITVDIARLTDDSRFETYKGDIKIGLPRDAAFELDTDLGRRTDFSSDFDAVYHSKRSSDKNMSGGKVNGGGPLLRLSSEKGRLRLRAE